MGCSLTKYEIGNCSRVNNDSRANLFIPEGRNVVETVWWVWEDSSLFVFILGSGTIFGSFISGCNMSPTDPRIVFIAVSPRMLSFGQKRVAIVQKCYRYLEACPYIYGTFVRFGWLLEVTRVATPHTQPPHRCCLSPSPEVRSTARHVEHELRSSKSHGLPGMSPLDTDWRVPPLHISVSACPRPRSFMSQPEGYTDIAE